MLPSAPGHTLPRPPRALVKFILRGVVDAVLPRVVAHLLFSMCSCGLIYAPQQHRCMQYGSSLWLGIDGPIAAQHGPRCPRYSPLAHVNFLSMRVFAPHCGDEHTVRSASRSCSTVGVGVGLGGAACFLTERRVATFSFHLKNSTLVCRMLPLLGIWGAHRSGVMQKYNTVQYSRLQRSGLVGGTIGLRLLQYTATSWVQGVSAGTLWTPRPGIARGVPRNIAVCGMKQHPAAEVQFSGNTCTVSLASTQHSSPVTVECSTVHSGAHTLPRCARSVCCLRTWNAQHTVCQLSTQEYSAVACSELLSNHEHSGFRMC